MIFVTVPDEFPHPRKYLINNIFQWVTCSGARCHTIPLAMSRQSFRQLVTRSAQEAAMSEDRRSVLEVLRYELNFLEQGGYRTKIQEGQSLSPFQESLSCLNFGEPLRPHACHECLLYDFVPRDARTEEIPCHHIELDPAGHTIASFLNDNKPLDLERALKVWLRKTIASMDQAEAKIKAD